MANTKVDLVKDIERILEVDINITEAQMKKGLKIIENAKNGDCHDFQSKHAAPKMQLHMELLDAGFKKLDEKMQSGGYDETSDIIGA